MIGILNKFVAVEEHDVAFYLDRDEGVHILPREDVDAFEEKVCNAFPERKDGRFGCLVKVKSDGTESYFDLEDRAVRRAKMLIGLEKQRIKLQARQS